MAAVTTDQMLLPLQQACCHSALAGSVETLVIDADTLSVVVYLTRAETFINVFYNVTTDETAFALVESGHRVYGVDDARKGWREHPFDNPAGHITCAPVQFESFLEQVEAHCQTAA